jgi:hypothetical protein
MHGQEIEESSELEIAVGVGVGLLESGEGLVSAHTDSQQEKHEFPTGLHGAATSRRSPRSSTQSTTGPPSRHVIMLTGKTSSPGTRPATESARSAMLAPAMAVAGTRMR